MNNEKNVNENSASQQQEHNLLSDFLKNIDTNFPLSGGETDEDLDESIESVSDDDDTDISEREHLDTNFPLSGGTQ